MTSGGGKEGGEGEWEGREGEIRVVMAVVWVTSRAESPRLQISE